MCNIIIKIYILYSVFTTQGLVPLHYHIFHLYLICPAALSLSPVGTTILLFVFMSFFLCILFVHLLLFVLYYKGEIRWFLSLSIWLILLGIIPSKSSHAVTNGNISSFSWLRSILIYIHIPYSTPKMTICHLYPIICWWKIRLFLCLDYCK